MKSVLNNDATNHEVMQTHELMRLANAYSILS